MNGLDFTLSGAQLTALPSGALWCAADRVLTVSDLHLGKSDRIARRSGTMLPPYEVQETLSRLETDITQMQPHIVVCLGDSFDDLTAAYQLRDENALWITRLQAGCRWIWIEGNHDPGPVALGGAHHAEFRSGPLVYRHIAQPGQTGEISGHYHPKTTLKTQARSVTRPCFLVDSARVIVPAYGTYTGGLRSHAPVLCELMQPDAKAILTGPTPAVIPMQRS